MGKHLLRCLLALRYRPFGRTILLAGFALIATATAVNPQGGGALAAAVEEKHRATVHVAIEQGLLTVDLHDAALADVLQAIAEMASFRLTLRGDLSTSLTWSFTDVPLDDGIKRLVGDNSLVMVYAPTNEANARLLSTVWVRAPGKGIVTIEPNPAAEPSDYSTHQGGDWLEGTARLRAARQLARQRDGAAADALVSLLTQDEDPVVRRIAAGGLGKIGGEQATAALKAALADENSLVRRRAILELGKIGKDEAAEALAGVLSDDPDADIRYFTARALARLGSMAARSALEAALADPEYMVRTAAAGALAEWQRIFDHSD